jgi:transposase
VSFSIEDSNKCKRDALLAVIEESKRVLQVYVDHYWPIKDSVGKYPYLKVESWVSSALLQSLGKDAISMIRALRKRKSKSKPTIKRIILNLDKRFFPDLTEARGGHFDLWFQMSGLGDRSHPIKLRLPLKNHTRYKKFVRDGWVLKKSFRLKMRDDKKLFLYFIFEKDELPPVTNGTVLGVDMGYRNLLATSRGELIGSDLTGVYGILCRKKRGSKAHKATLRRKDCEVNRALNRLDLHGVKALAIEALKNVKYKSHQRGKMATKAMNHVQWWSYPKTIQKLKRLSEERGIRLVEFPPAYTSQTCPECGSVDKENRHGDVFKCTRCAYEGHADVVGAINVQRRGEVTINDQCLLSPTKPLKSVLADRQHVPLLQDVRGNGVQKLREMWQILYEQGAVREVLHGTYTKKVK